MDVPEDARRYSPPRLAEAFPTPIYGDPDEKRIRTSHVETKSYDADVHAQADSSDKWVQQEVEQS